jgi:hypothetical protein
MYNMYMHMYMHMYNMYMLYTCAHKKLSKTSLFLRDLFLHAFL